MLKYGNYEQRLRTGNHQALRGLALLYAGSFLNDPEYTRAGNIVCNFHLTQDFMPDGMSIDLSPSYHVFEAWIGRDALALGDISQEARASLAKAFRVCRGFRQPNGFSIVLNNGYSLDMSGFLASVGEDCTSQGASLLPDSGLAFYHAAEFFALLDATPRRSKYAHYHGGKAAVTLWFAGQPFLIDSGCCSYDDPDFWGWYKLPQAHSTLVVNGEGDSELKGRYEWVKSQEYRLQSAWQANSIECASPVWRRKMTVNAPSEVILDDQVQLPEPADVELLFILHPTLEVDFEEERIVLCQDRTAVLLHWEADAPITWRLSPGKCFIKDRSVPSQRLHLCAKTADLNLRTVWHLKS